MTEKQKDALWQFLVAVKWCLRNLIKTNVILSSREKDAMVDKLQETLDEVFDTLMY